jgi:hypothetical protein
MGVMTTVIILVLRAVGRHLTCAEAKTNILGHDTIMPFV